MSRVILKENAYQNDADCLFYPGDEGVIVGLTLNGEYTTIVLDRLPGESWPFLPSEFEIVTEQ